MNITSVKFCRYEVMQSCWSFLPEDRPTFTLLVDRLAYYNCCAMTDNNC